MKVGKQYREPVPYNDQERMPAFKADSTCFLPGSCRPCWFMAKWVSSSASTAMHAMAIDMLVTHYKSDKKCDLTDSDYANESSGCRC